MHYVKVVLLGTTKEGLFYRNKQKDEWSYPIKDNYHRSVWEVNITRKKLNREWGNDVLEEDGVGSILSDANGLKSTENYTVTIFNTLWMVEKFVS